MAAHLVWKHSKRKQADVAHVRFWFHGRKYFRSLKTTDEAAAKSKLWKATETLRRLEQGDLQLPEDCTHDDAFDFIISGGKPRSRSKLVEKITFERVAGDYFDALPEGAKEDSSLRTEETHATHLARLLGGKTPFRAIGVAEIQKYVSDRRKVEGRRGRPIQPVTIKKELQTFKQLWDFARVRQYVDGDCPTQHAKLPKADEKPPFMTWEQIEAAIKQGGLTEQEEALLWDCLFLRKKEVLELLDYVRENAEHQFIYPMFAMAGLSGARRSEIIRSKVQDFDLGSKEALLREKKRKRAVNISYRRIRLHDELHRVMEDWFKIHPGGPHTICTPPNLFRSKSKSDSPQPLSRSQTTDHFNRTLRGSKWQTVRGFHVLRHSFASICAMHGIRQSIIDQWLGHQTEAMRNRYQHLFPEETRKAMESLAAPDVGRLFRR